MFMSSYLLKSFKTLYILLSDVIIVQEKGTFDEIFFAHQWDNWRAHVTQGMNQTVVWLVDLCVITELSRVMC